MTDSFDFVHPQLRAFNISVSFGSWLCSRLMLNGCGDLGWQIPTSSSIRNVSALSKRAGLLGLSSTNGVLALGLASICTWAVSYTHLTLPTIYSV